MSSNGTEAKLPSPHRPRHQISRSISELSPIRLHRHNHHHSPHVRRDADRHREKDRDRDEQLHTTRSAASALQPRVSLEVPGSEAADTPNNLSPDQSRRTSILIAGAEDAMAVPPLEFGSGALLHSRKLSRDEELQQEKQKAAVRASGLKKSLVDLSTFSDATTRRLDDTYYSVLEKLGMLQGTIVALKELAGMSQETNKQFKKESEDLAAEITTQLDSFNGFKEQEVRIESLTARIHGGRDKVKALSDRVDLVRERIEGWERADREWQERTRRRLKATWVVTSTVLFALLILLIAAQYVPASLEEAVTGVANESHHGPLNGVPETGARRMLGPSLNRTARDSGLDVEETLRAFDEL